MSSPFEVFLQRITESGLEFFRKFYGLYRADVMRVDDPEKRGRIQILCAEVGHAETINVWVDPSFSGAGTNRGTFWPPEVGDSVWVSFAFGRPNSPKVYFGGWFGDKDVPTELGYAGSKDSPQPKRRGFITRAGHMLVFNDESGKESVELVWNKPESQPKDPDTAKRPGKKASLLFDKDGSVTISNQNNSTVVMDAKNKSITIEDKDNKNTIVLDSSGVKISTSKDVVISDAANCTINAQKVTLATGADSSAVRGNDLVQWLQVHTHPTAMGPSGPPVTAGMLPMTLSQVVKLK